MHMYTKKGIYIDRFSDKIIDSELRCFGGPYTNRFLKQQMNSNALLHPIVRKSLTPTENLFKLTNPRILLCPLRDLH